MVGRIQVRRQVHLDHPTGVAGDNKGQSHRVHHSHNRVSVDMSFGSFETEGGDEEEEGQFDLSAGQH